MNNYKIIDMHAHIYPEKIAKKAVSAIGDFYGLKMDAEGTGENLIKTSKPYGAVNYLVQSVATSPHQVKSINEFIKNETLIHPEFIGFGTLHPACDDFDCDFEQIVSLGLHGIKLHPDFQKFNIDDERACEIYKRAEGRYPILFHMGDDRYDFSSPERLRRIVEKFPDLTVIAAHFGGYQKWKEAQNELAGLDIYFDTSSSLNFIDNDYAVELIHLYGCNHMIFGTDYPMWDFQTELKRFLSLNLTEEERRMILYDNAAQLLKLNS